jgi:hypothetical protein
MKIKFTQFGDYFLIVVVEILQALVLVLQTQLQLIQIAHLTFERFDFGL